MSSSQPRGTSDTGKRSEEIEAQLAALTAELQTTREQLRSSEANFRRATAERQSFERALESSEELHRRATDRLHSDLALAREIQQGLLPEAAPDWDDLTLRCFTKPAVEIGGDFYTYSASNNPGVLLNK